MKYLFIFILMFAFIPSDCSGDYQTASWYSVKSCLREGTTGVMANGRKLRDDRLTAASWDHPFGTRLKVVNLKNGRAVIVEVTDRGPNKKLYRSGRVVDLSKAAFAAIADLNEGIIPVKVQKGG